jgi:Dyp-type peroxidase family
MSGAPVRLLEEALEDVQGFITSAYGHLPFSAYLFVHFHQAPGARQWLSSIADSVTTSARWRTPDGTPRKPSSALNVAFTAPGLASLGVPAPVLCTFPGEFREGMASGRRSHILGDADRSAPEHWQLGGSRTPPVHAMLLLHGASAAAIAGACEAQRSVLEAAGGAVAEIPGSAQEGRRPEDGREPFGFHDGIAQPTILGVAGRGVPTGEFILGYLNHYQLIPPTPVVPAAVDPRGVLPASLNPYHPPNGFRDLGQNGSYIVYRKLHQDVAAFWRAMTGDARLQSVEDVSSGAQRAGLRGLATASPGPTPPPRPPGGSVWHASRAVGRWPGGAPVSVAPDADDPAFARHDAFYYSDDPSNACPLGAHIRRSNPRDILEPYGVQESLSMTEAHRLLRRGRVFGPPLFDHRLLDPPITAASADALARLEDDGRERGVHFLCVCASISSQFEFVQQTWCINPRFGGLDGQPDPLLRFITTMGGAYFFMPGMRALRFLATVE